MKTYLGAKIQRLRVTGKSVDYTGSVTVCRTLLDAAGIDPYEQVHVVNLETGARWVTYAIPGEDGVFELNGGGARLGEPGDRCVLMVFVGADCFPGARVVYCNPENQIEKTFKYARP